MFRFGCFSFGCGFTVGLGCCCMGCLLGCWFASVTCFDCVGFIVGWVLCLGLIGLLCVSECCLVCLII